MRHLQDDTSTSKNVLALFTNLLYQDVDLPSYPRVGTELILPLFPKVGSELNACSRTQGWDGTDTASVLRVRTELLALLIPHKGFPVAFLPGH